MHAVLITFRSSIPVPELEEPFRRYAQALTTVPGLVMKTWIADADRLGGFHIFDDATSASGYTEGELFATIRANPAFTDISVHDFEVLDLLSVVTGSPTSRAMATP